MLTLEERREYNRKRYAANSERIREYNRKWFAANPEKVKASDRRAGLKLYGLTPADYDAILAAQGGVCAICRKPCNTGRRLSVDHCHATGVVRGLLCIRCNTTIGHHFDSPEELRCILRYVEKHSQLRLVKGGR